MAEQRRHERFGVRLKVTYTDAAQFVSDYVENLSVGGLFIAGEPLPLLSEREVEIDLPGQGKWRVRAKAVFALEPLTAARQNRRPGTGFQIVDKPTGFDDALLGYLLRLGRRRDVAVMIGEVPGEALIAQAGYRIAPLVGEAELAAALASADPPIVAIVVPLGMVPVYKDRAGEIVFSLDRVEDIPDLIARIDSLL